MSKQKCSLLFCISVYQDLLTAWARQQFKKFGQKSVTSIQDKAKWWCFIIYLFFFKNHMSPVEMIRTKLICLKVKHFCIILKKPNLLVSLFIHLSKYVFILFSNVTSLKWFFEKFPGLLKYLKASFWSYWIIYLKTEDSALFSLFLIGK